MFESCRILDLYVHRVTLDAVCEQLDAFIRSRRPHQVATVNMDFLHLGRTDTAFREAVNGADLVVPDGMPVIWASRLLGVPLMERVTGVDILERGAALAADRGYSIFLLGAAPGVAEQAAAELVRRHPTLRIAGTYAPPIGPFSDEEQTRMIAAVRAARPDMLFVAFGAPRQDVWIHQHLEDLDVPLCVGVGGAFNFIAGNVKRAPIWMRRTGLEWVHRLIQEPGRLWRRYLLQDLPVFLRLMSAGLIPFPPLRRLLLGSRPTLMLPDERFPLSGNLPT
jgi:N-acetylglucosaminyldiphosphoundecaprenol N-acetyl-beta-D-mannosaminyltransferase